MRANGYLAVSARGLRREFFPHRGFFRKGAPFVAVDGIDLDIESGTVYGLLGPNGAGKTTTIKMLSTLLLPSSGSATVSGYDIVREEGEVRRRLGVLLGGDRGLYGKISAADNLRYFATLYGVPARQTERRVQALLEMVGLSHRQSERVEGFSRGMKQRVHLAKALIHEPEVVILDEPTIGLDPEAAHQLREVVQNLVPRHTVLLTTHYLAEADELCNRIAIIDHGRIIAEDTPAGIKSLVGGANVLQIQVDGHVDSLTRQLLESAPGVETVRIRSDRDSNSEEVEISSGELEAVTNEVMRVLVCGGCTISSVATRDVTLEEAFLSLTGTKDAARVEVAS